MAINLFNNLNLSDIKIILQKKDEDQNIPQEFEKKDQLVLNLHKAILINFSDYFKILFDLNFKESNENEVIIFTEYVKYDEIILEYIYSQTIKKILDMNFESKLICLIRSKFYGIEKLSNKIIKNIFSKIRPNQLSHLVDNYHLIPEIKDNLIKYIRLFFVNIDKLDDLMDKIYEIDPSILNLIFISMLNNSMMANSRETVQKFTGIYDVNVTSIEKLHSNYNILVRNTTKTEKERFKYFPKIEMFVIFKMHPYIVAKFMLKYKFFEAMTNINYATMLKIHRKHLSECCDDIKVIKKINLAL